MQTTVLFKYNYNATAQVVVNQGGTSSGKTYAILQVLFTLAAAEKPVITIVGQDIPNLKSGAMRDAATICSSSAALQQAIKGFNKTDRIYEFTNSSVIEFKSYGDAQDAKSGKRDYLFVNEANGINWDVYTELALRTRKRIFIDYNPNTGFWVHEKLLGKPGVKLIISDHRHNHFLDDAMHQKIESLKKEDVELWMIHKPMVGSGGNADELLKDVQMLNVVQSRLAQIYMDKSGLDGVTVNSLINSVTWMTADQAFNLGFIDTIEVYADTVINSALIKKYTDTAPAVYQRCINKILTQKTTMNMDSRELIERTTSVLDKIMNFFKKVVNKQTITDKGTLHHSGEMCEGAEVYQDEDMTTPAITDTYTTADGGQLAIEKGKVQKVSPAEITDEDDEEDVPANKFTKAGKPADIQNKIKEVKARMHAQNALLNEAKAALEEANRKLNKTREEVKNEIKSDFTPEGSKRSSKAKTETQPFFAPQSPLAQNAVKKAVGK